MAGAGRAGVILTFSIGVVLGLEARAQTGPQVSFSGDLGVGGSITTGAGIEFPDGTVQTTAAGPGTSGITANAGLYDNRIVDFSPPVPYTEVCFNDLLVTFDVHDSGGESAAGGNCAVGDRGWILERGVRLARTWEEARAECLISEMRLIEPFEYLFSCGRAEDAGLLEFGDSHEWVGNEVTPMTVSQDGPFIALVVPILGKDFCQNGGWGYVASHVVPQADQFPFRCAR